MNKSEISARLVNVKWQIMQYIIDDYENLKRSYEYIIHMTLDNDKQFINNFIIHYDFGSIYNITFSDSTSNYIANVNKLCKFYINRIEHFLKHAYKIMNNTKNIIKPCNEQYRIFL